VPITLITGPANAGKAREVMSAVRRHLAHGVQPLLIVPTQAGAEHYRCELVRAGVVLGARVERFEGLIGEAVRRAGTGEPALGRIARERVLAKAAGAPGGGVQSTPGLLRALAVMVAELEVQRVTPARLGAALRAWEAADGGDATAGVEELWRCFGEYRRILAQIGRTDHERRAAQALDALRRKPALWGATPVIMYGFDDFGALQLDVIETLGTVVGAPVTVSLTYEPGRAAFAGRAGTFQTIAPLASEHRRLQARAEYYAPAARTALHHLERSLFEPGAGREDAAGAVRLLEGGGERAELELVAGEIAQLLEQGMAAGDVAVLARPASTSMELLEEVFGDARIPFSLQRRRVFADTAIGRALIGLLRCVAAPGNEASEAGEAGAENTAAGEPSSRAPGELGDLLAWLRAPGLLDVPALADSLELRARRSGALSAGRARLLWEERNWRLETLDHLQVSQQRGAAALIERSSRELYWLFCAPRRSRAELLAASELDEAAALAAGRRALAQLRELAQIAPELAPARAAELAGVELLSGERPLAGAVAVLEALSLLNAEGGRHVRALFVCGLQEGVFPQSARAQPLLSEQERRRLAEVSGLLLREREDLLASERYLLYAAVSRPQERLVLSWHSADDDGQTTPRSLFVDDVCDLFEPELLATRAWRRLGAVDDLALARSNDSSALEALAADSGASAQAEGADEPLRDTHLLGELAARPWSASSLERWIGCPVAWFVERLLRPDALESDPEPLARGALAHAALKDTLEGLRRETGSARLTRGNLARARELLASALAGNEAGHPLSVAPERRAAVRRRLQADLDRYLTLAAESESPLAPRELELGFGFEEGDERGEASQLPAFELGGGVRLRGRIDRVDADEAGNAVVYDYKGKGPPGAARWIKDGKLQVALYMRATEELLGLRAAGGFYQPLTGSDLRPRGVLDADSGLELDCVSTDVREHAELRELLDQAVAVAREVAAQAAGGRLQARPDTCAFKGGCQYPTICRCER
jgi:ATP-dependent helicase/DNAse subunit B